MRQTPMSKSLIGPSDPAPVSVHNEGGTASVLVVCDHASRAIPQGMSQLGVEDWVLDRHVAWDIGAASVARALADALDAPAILAGYSRLVVDPNRAVEDATAFVQVNDGIVVPANLGLSREEKRRRVECFFDPYHAAISTRLRAFRKRGVAPGVIAVHTYVPVLNRVVRQWHVGVMWDKDPRIALPLITRLSSLDGLYVGDNEPYSGRHPHDFTLDHHAEAAGLPYVGIEVRQDLAATEDGARKWGNLLAEALRAILADEDLYRPLNT